MKPTLTHTLRGYLSAGGNGIAASLSVFQQLSSSTAAGVPALIIWCCRHVGEFELMAPVVLAMARTLGLQLTTKFFYTGTFN